MNTIQLKHDEVMKRLTKVKEALAALALPNPNQQVLGNNKLDLRTSGLRGRLLFRLTLSHT
ncbi:YwqI/YxiC family protein [Bacillus sp. DNRA2]|uniref:YwqI/YxiC family protein n=1 Tax=Bacillus sp. DNRA2 TaxID=2723053 RepID=UPI002006DA02|nr:YwqI/YxiC family protein [Bacillus sp. DNRA2]